jgi:hypothetical protein
MRSILTDAIYRKHKEWNGIIKTYSTIALAKSAMERIPLHSREMEFSIQYHVTINSELNDQNSIRYYINSDIHFNVALIVTYDLINFDFIW